MEDIVKIQFVRNLGKDLYNDNDYKYKGCDHLVVDGDDRKKILICGSIGGDIGMWNLSDYRLLHKHSFNTSLKGISEWGGNCVCIFLENKGVVFSFVQPYGVVDTFSLEATLTSSETIQLSCPKNKRVATGITMCNRIYHVDILAKSCEELRRETSYASGGKALRSIVFQNCVWFNLMDSNRRVVLMDVETGDIRKSVRDEKKKVYVYSIAVFLNSKGEEILVTAGVSMHINFYNCGTSVEENGILQHSVRVEETALFDCCVVGNFLSFCSENGSFLLLSVQNYVKNSTVAPKIILKSDSIVSKSVGGRIVSASEMELYFGAERGFSIYRVSGLSFKMDDEDAIKDVMERVGFLVDGQKMYIFGSACIVKLELRNKRIETFRSLIPRL